MTPTQEALFGKFPRDAGIPSRFPLFSRGHFKSFMEKSNGRHNLYCSIARYDYPDYYCDTVFYDFDAGWDGLFSVGDTPPEKFRKLREDSSLAEEFLGDVIEESKRLVSESLSQEIPVLGVFTGKGLHIYQFYQEKKHPRKEMLSTANKFKEELNLDHLDPKPIGDVMRIARIPGSRRMWDDRKCPLFTTPLTPSEVLEMDAEWLLSTSSEPRRVSIGIPDERPEMQVYDNHLRTTVSNKTRDDFNPAEVGIEDEFLEWYIRRVVKMPCVAERALTKDPDHYTRLNLAIHLFNVGLSKKSVFDIISQLNWRDFDREETKKQLNQIYRRGYQEFGCKRMRDEELCVHSDNPRECPTYGWRNAGECRWNQ